MVLQHVKVGVDNCSTLPFSVMYCLLLDNILKSLMLKVLKGEASRGYKKKTQRHNKKNLDKYKQLNRLLGKTFWMI